MGRKIMSMLLGVTMAVTLLSGCNTPEENENGSKLPVDTGPTVTDWTVNYDGIATGTIQAGVSVHDPSIIQVGDEYYIFGSHMAGANSRNLRIFSQIDEGYTTTNSIYGNLWNSSKPVFQYAGDKTSIIPTDDGGTHVWAPDVCYNPVTGLYYLYYCTTSTFFSPISAMLPRKM